MTVNVAGLLLLGLLAFSSENGGDEGPATRDIDLGIIDKLSSLGDFFTENAGQVANDQVRFYSSGGMQAGFAESAVLLKIVERNPARPLDPFERGMGGSYAPPDDVPSVRGVMVRITFGGSNRVTPQGLEEMPHRSNFFLGSDPANWRTGVRNYREIVYSGLYDGIDLVYRMQGGQLKYDFLVRPGADPALITISYAGVDGVRLDNSGELVVTTALGELRDGRPTAYQEGRDVECAYAARARRSFGFQCGGRDPSRPLVIDPLLYSTYLGGSYDDVALGLAVDSAGSAYVTGMTESADFPVVLGAFDAVIYDYVFVTKLNPAGDALAYSTLLAGSYSRFSGNAIAVDPSGNAYVTGVACEGLPVTAGSYDTTYNGGGDAFAAKLNSTGRSLLYSTYLGGGGLDEGTSIAVDAAGNAYVTGYTHSSNFSVTPSAYDSTLGGDEDGFVTKLNPNGSSLLYSTYIGGDDFDASISIEIDASGSAYLTGSTDSSDFPVTPGAFDTTFAGSGSVAFVTKLDTSGSSLLYSTYVGGGSQYEGGLSIAVDSAGNAYFTGETRASNFPITQGAFDATLGGLSDAFAAKLNSNGSSLLYSTYLGGSCGGAYMHEVGYSVTVDSSGSAYVSGLTCSTDFPVTPGALDTTLGGQDDAFVTKLDPSGGSLLYSTYLGGSAGDGGNAIAVDETGSIFVAGGTFSADFPVTPGAFDTTFDGVSDAFVVKVNRKILVDSGADGGVWWFPQYGTYNPSLPHQGKALADCFRAAGYEVRELPGDGSVTITRALLADYEMVFAAAPGKAYGTSEVDAYRAFLDSGKGVFIASEFDGNRLSPHFGLAMDGSLPGQVTRFVDHPLTRGVTSLDFMVGSQATSYPNGTEILGYLSTGEPVLGTFPVGSGRIVFFGDTNALENAPQPFTDNYLRFFLGSGVGCASANAPPVADAGGPYAGHEGDAILLSAANSSDPDGNPLQFRWDFTADGTWDTSWSTDPTASAAFGDDFIGSVCVEVSDGDLTSVARAPLVVRNREPWIGVVGVLARGNLTLRVAGEKWHDVVLRLYKDRLSIANASVTRSPGSPDDQAAAIENVTIDLLDGGLSAVMMYTPDDDPINGQPNGANPAWLTFTANDGSASTLHHTFNVRQEDSWVWNIGDLRALAAGTKLTFAASATDPGSDDLTFTWEWDDGTPATVAMHFNDGLGPDPYPSPGGTFPFTATDSTRHVFSMAGNHKVRLTVSDDDGGWAEFVVVLIIP